MVKNHTTRKPNKQSEEVKSWEVILPKRKEPTLEETIDWLKFACKGYYHYTIRKNYVRYEFHDLDDAFRFKLIFERA